MNNGIQQVIKRLMIGLKKARPERTQDTNALIEAYKELTDYLKGENSTIATLECVLEMIEDGEQYRPELLRRLSDWATLYPTDLSISCHKVVDLVAERQIMKGKLADEWKLTRSLQKENEDLRNALVAQAVVNSGGTPKPPMKTTGIFGGNITLKWGKEEFKNLPIDFQ